MTAERYEKIIRDKIERLEALQEEMKKIRMADSGIDYAVLMLYDVLATYNEETK